MNRILEQLTHMLLTPQDNSVQLHELRIEFLKKSDEILRIVQLCKRSNGIIGVYADTLGKGMFLVTVRDIIKNKTLVFQSINGDGKRGDKIWLDISEVRSVCPFNQHYVEVAEEAPAPVPFMHHAN